MALLSSAHILKGNTKSNSNSSNENNSIKSEADKDIGKSKQIIIFWYFIFLNCFLLRDMPVCFTYLSISLFLYFLIIVTIELYFLVPCELSTLNFYFQIIIIIIIDISLLHPFTVQPTSTSSPSPSVSTSANEDAGETIIYAFSVGFISSPCSIHPFHTIKKVCFPSISSSFLSLKRYKNILIILFLLFSQPI